MLLRFFILFFLILFTPALSSQCILNFAGDACVGTCPRFSSSDGSQCVCDAGFQVSRDLTSCECQTGYLDIQQVSCVVTCPARSSPTTVYCSCDTSYVQNGNMCLCYTSTLAIDLDGLSCVSACSSNSSPVNGLCKCDSPYVLSGNSCVPCSGSDVLNLDGTACVSSCPARSSSSGSQCVCDGSFQTSGDGQSCVCPNSGDKIDVGGAGCISQCPLGSYESNGQCFCYAAFQTNGNTCGCSAGMTVNLGGTGCIANCPQYSSPVIWACTCFTGFTMSSDSSSCECNGGKSISVDGLSCGSSCSPHSSAVGGQCVCENSFVQDGNSCKCATGKVLNIIGDYCLDSCPLGSFDNSGQCQCYGCFTANGNSCECPASNPIINLDGTACISLCPSYSSGNSGQCICDGTLVLNGNTCGCGAGPGTIISLAGTGCVFSCPSHSSDQGGGQCQCDAPWVLETVNKGSCVCPSSLHLSLDLLNCITPCPAHTTVVNNACVCDSTSKFVLSSDQQSCECKPGTVYDPGSDTCLFICDSSCKTCFGSNSNECFSCYSGYQLSTSKTCNEITTKSSLSVEVAKTTGKISSASIATSSVASAENSGAMRVSLVGNMFQYLKFMNISYSEQLVDMLENLSSQFLPWNIDVGIPRSMQDESNYKTLPYQFTKYEQIHPSFLMNFWDDLSILVVVIGVVGVLVGLQFVVNKFCKQKTLWKVVFSKTSLMSQSFLLTFTYNDLGNVIFFGLLDFKSAKSYSGVHVLNLIIAISLLLAEIGILTVHYTLLVKYRRIKRARLNPHRAKEIEEFLEKYENLKAFFEDFNDFSFAQQCFLLVAVLRDMLSNLILVTLYQYPLAEGTLFMAFSLLMIVYILYSGPFKDILNAIQQILCELILLLVNTCVFINAVLDHIDSNDYDVRKKLGSIVVVSNTVFNFVPMAFLAIVLWQISKELYTYIKGWRDSRKLRDIAKKGDLSLKSESSKLVLKGLSLEEGPVRSEENGNRAGSRLNEDLEVSRSSRSQMLSKDNSGILETKLDGGDQGHDKLVAENQDGKSSHGLEKKGMRKVKIKRRLPTQQRNAELEGSDACK